MKKPIPYDQADPKELSKVKGVCLDIDDTLTTHGKLTAPAFEALWKLKSAGYKVVPVTGRPAGWCDLIARFWPVDAVIGENGAFSFFMKDGVRRRSDTPGAAPGHRQLLRGLEATVLKRFPHARWASDQSYREYDLAIDFCEDVPRWPQADLDELVALCEKVGAHAKVSSIHLNAWFGSYDKRKGFEHWLGQGAPGVEGAVPAADEWLFIGDSPNDEPLFESFDLSVGVANLQPFLARLKSPPRWLTSSQSGSGFGEMVAGLLKGSAKK